MTDNDITTICGKIESLHDKIIKSKFSEMVTESEMICLILAVQELNRQKAEIEQLKIENRILSQKRISFPERLEIDRKARAKAVKEFAERFENELTKIEEIYFDEEHENFISANKVIALLVNLVKEMEGENNAPCN